MSKQKGTAVEYRSYYLPPQFPVLLLSGDYWRISDVPSKRLHFHNCLEIGLCRSDGGTLKVGGEDISFREGDVTILPRNVLHTTYSAQGTKSLWSYLFMDPKELLCNVLPAAWSNYELSPDGFPSFRYVFGKEEYPNIHTLVSYIICEMEKKEPCYEISVLGLISSLYIELYRIESRTANADSKGGTEHSLVLAPALNYIENNYMKAVTIEELAQLCHWSVPHFRRIFNEIMGIGPLEFVNNTRIQKSCILLRSTEKSVLEIAGMVGFHSISSYNRQFIKLMQLSPREYRQKMRQTQNKSEKQIILEFNGWMKPEE